MPKPPKAKPSARVKKMAEAYKARRRQDPRTHCEVVAVSSLADAIGDHCERIAARQCSDCGTPICSVHSETCEMCADVFCPSCLSFHQAQAPHPKPATGEHEKRERKSA